MRKEHLLKGEKLIKFTDQKVSADGQYLTSVPPLPVSSLQAEQHKCGELAEDHTDVWKAIGATSVTFVALSQFYRQLISTCLLFGLYNVKNLK